MLQGFLYLLVVIPWTVFCIFIAMLAAFLDRSGRSYHRVALLWSRGALLAAGARVEVAGTEHIPLDRPLVFMGNHQSNFDIPALLLAAPVHFSWLAKEELFRVPVLGSFMRSAGYIPIKRGDHRGSLKSIFRAAALVESGTSVAIFPEGTHSFDGRLLPFKRGGFILAAKAGAAIIPFSISGSMQINPPGNLFSIKSGVIKIRFSPLVMAEQHDSLRQTIVMGKVRQAIAGGLEF